MQIERMTIAVTHMAEFVEFYNTVFESNFTPMVDLVGFYHGKLCDLEVLLCPNQIACVVAAHNRHQFRFMVDDLDEVISKCRAAGGQPLDDAQADRTSRGLGMRDPDGNSMEFVQYLG